MRTSTPASRSGSALLFAIVLALLGCGGSKGTADAGACETGTVRCLCYGNGTCNAGLMCASNLCVVLPGSGGTVGAGGSTGAGGGTAGAAGGAGASGSGGSAGGHAAGGTGGVTATGGAAGGGGLGTGGVTATGGAAGGGGLGTGGATATGGVAGSGAGGTAHGTGGSGTGGSAGSSGGTTGGAAASGGAGTAGAGGGAGGSGGAGDVAAPRPIAPISMSSATTRHPTFRWALAGGSDGARLTICRDRACSTVVQTIDATGSSAAPTTDLPPGVLFWSLRGRSGNSVGSATSATWEVVVGAANAPVNTAWGTMSDVNGDGYADVVASGLNVGAVYVYPGKSTGPPIAPATTLTSPDGDATFGNPFASAGDVNGDGYSDLIVASEVENRAYVYLGGPNGLSTTPAAAIDNPVQDGAYFPQWVAGLGDVNGDGYGDVAVGEEQSTVITQTYIYFGSATGLSTTPGAILNDPASLFGPADPRGAGDVNGDGYDDIVTTSDVGPLIFLGSPSGPPTHASITLTGVKNGVVDTAGDINGDGYADVMVGQGGTVYFFLGGATGPATIPSATLVGPSGSTASYGAVLASVGDANGDGFGDIVIGDDDAFEGATNQGVVFYYLGSATGFAGPPSGMLGASKDSVGAYFGAAVAGPGDVDGDGFADVVASAIGLNSNAGQVYVFSGAKYGVDPSATAAPMSPAGTKEFGYTLASAEGDISTIVLRAAFAPLWRPRRGAARALYAGPHPSSWASPMRSLQGRGCSSRRSPHNFCVQRSSK